MVFAFLFSSNASTSTKHYFPCQKDIQISFMTCMLQKEGECKITSKFGYLWNIFPGTCNYKWQQKFEMSQWTTICHTMGSDGLKVNERQIWHRIISSFVLGYKDNPVKFLESDAHWLRITGWGADSSTSIYVTLWNISLKDKYKQRKSDGPFCFIAVVKLKQWWPCCDILCMRPPSQDKRDIWGIVFLSGQTFGCLPVLLLMRPCHGVNYLLLN